MSNLELMSKLLMIKVNKAIRMRNVAFVYTEYQQNILFAICLQEKIQLDVIFVRNNISMHHDIHNFAKKVILIEDIPFSWRSMRGYYREYKNIILPEINPEESYLVFSWSIENPLVRLALNELKKKKIYLLEDGAGSYVKRGLFQLGIKHFLATVLIDSLVDVISFKVKPYSRKSFVGWSLYDNCFPDFKIEKKIIKHKYFQKSMMGLIENNEMINLEKASIVFIQQPYVEMTILNEEEYIKIHTDAVMKMTKYMSDDCMKIIWKLHPRTNIEDEYRRIEKIEIQTCVKLEIMKERCNMEHVAYVNKENAIRYFSLGSSSLYVILALVSKSTSVSLIENETLKQELSTQEQVNTFYNSIGIKSI